MFARRLLITLLAFSASLRLCGAQPPAPAKPEVDVAEVARWGDHVQYVDGLHGDASAEQLAGDALSVPADDNHKWFITIFGMKGCPACSRLKADIKADQEAQRHLGAFITLAADDDTHSSTKKGWSHYNYLRIDDEAQKFRCEPFAVKRCPTIIIQTPLNEKFGPKGTVIFRREGYDGRPDKLAADMAEAIRAYVKKISEPRAAAGGQYAARGGYRAGPNDAEGLWGGPYDPPFAPPPKNDPVPGPSPFVLPDFNIPPLNTPPVAPKPDEPKPSDIPKVPEISIVVDGTALSSDDNKLLQPVIDRLKRERPGLKANIRDYRDAKCLAIKKEDLPAIVVTADGEVQERLTAKLFPLFNPPAPAPAPVAAPVVPQQITVPAPVVNVTAPEGSPFPWDQAITTVTSGGSIASWIALAGALFAWWRSRRVAKAAATAVVAPTSTPTSRPILEKFAQLAANLAEKAGERMLEKMLAPKPVDPTVAK